MRVLRSMFIPGALHGIEASFLAGTSLRELRDAVSADLCARKVFRGGPSLDIDGTLQLLNSDHVRERYRALLRSIFVGSVQNGFLLGKMEGQDVPCKFCGGRDSDGHLFWDCTLSTSC